MCALALLSKPSVVCLVQSGPSGIRTFKAFKHRRKMSSSKDKDKSNQQSEYSTKNTLKSILRQNNKNLHVIQFQKSICMQVQACLLAFSFLLLFVVRCRHRSLQIIIPNGNLCHGDLVLTSPINFLSCINVEVGKHRQLYLVLNV